MDPAEHRLVRWLFMTAAVAFLIVQEGAVTGYDGQTMYEVTRAIVEGGTFAISDEFNTLPGHEGRHYSRYGLGLSLVAAVPYLAVRPIAMASGDPDDVLEAAVSSVMAMVSAALIVAVYMLARRTGARPAAAVLVGAGAVVGTFVLPYSKEFFSEPLTALFVVVGMERLLARRHGMAGLAMGAAVLVRAQTLLFMPVLLLVAWWKDGARAAFHTAAGAALGILATFAYNIARFEGPLRFGYEDVGFTTPFAVGASGLLFHPTKSVFLFAPIVVVLPFALWRLWRYDLAAFVLIAANLGITFIAVAMWFAWHGGWCWGPRLLIPGLTPAIAAVGPWIDRRRRMYVAAWLFAAGFALSLPALIVHTQAQQFEVPRVPREGHYLPTQPLASPSPWRQLQLVFPTARYSIEHAYTGLPDGKNYLRYLSLWQVGMTRVLRRTGLVVSLALTSLLLLAFVVCARKTRASLREVARGDSQMRETPPRSARQRGTIREMG